MLEFGIIKHFERMHGISYSIFSARTGACLYDEIDELWVTPTQLIIVSDSNSLDDSVMRIISSSQFEDIKIYREPKTPTVKED